MFDEVQQSTLIFCRVISHYYDKAWCGTSLLLPCEKHCYMEIIFCRGFSARMWLQKRTWQDLICIYWKGNASSVWISPFMFDEVRQSKLIVCRITSHYYDKGLCATTLLLLCKSLAISKCHSRRSGKRTEKIIQSYGHCFRHDVLQPKVQFTSWPYLFVQ